MQKKAVSDEEQTAKEVSGVRSKQVFKAARGEAKGKKMNTTQAAASKISVEHVQQQALATTAALQPATRYLESSQTVSPPLTQQHSTTTSASYQPPAPMQPTTKPVSSAMRGYRRDAEHRERRRPQVLQMWPRFEKWWNASFRQYQDHNLTPQEKMILQRPEPSTERGIIRRLRPAPSVLTHTAAEELTVVAVQTQMSGDDVNALFGDNEEEEASAATEQQAQQSIDSRFATEEELLGLFEDDEEL